MKAGLRGIQVQPVTRGHGGKNETAARRGSSVHFGRLVRGVSTCQPVAGIRSGGARGALGVSQSVACRGTQGHSVRTIGTARNLAVLRFAKKACDGASRIFSSAHQCPTARSIVRFRPGLPVRGCQPSAARKEETLPPAKRKGAGRGIIEAP